MPGPGAAPGVTQGVCWEHLELVSKARPLGLFCPESPHSFPRQGHTKDPIAVFSSKIPCVWERGIFCLREGALEGDLTLPPLNPGAELCDEVKSDTHCWASSWHLWVSSRRIRHPAELLALPQATSSCSGSSSLKLLPMAFLEPPQCSFPPLSPPCPSGQSWWLKQ